MVNEKVAESIMKIVQSRLEKKLLPTSGTVTKTYYEVESDSAEDANRNCVDIELIHPENGTKQILERVPIAGSNLMGGVEGARLKKDDSVIVSFYNGDWNMPRVIAKVNINPRIKNIEMMSEKGNTMPDADGYFEHYC